MSCLNPRMTEQLSLHLRQHSNAWNGIWDNAALMALVVLLVLQAHQHQQCVRYQVGIALVIALPVQRLIVIAITN